MRRVLWLVLLSSVGCVGDLAVTPTRPVADAGFDQVRFMGTAPKVTIELDGRASCDPVGAAPVTMTWAVLSAPGEHPALVTNGLHATFDASEPGDYAITATAHVGDRISDVDTVTIQVRTGNGDDVVTAAPHTDACGTPLP
jgi:hypothetical protein